MTRPKECKREMAYGSHDQSIAFDREEEMLDFDLAETLFR